jgi:hypothetical protein
MVSRVALFLFLFAAIFKCGAACTAGIPEKIKQQYASQFQNAFVLQSEGFSFGAMCAFEHAYELAKNSGESSVKIEAIRRLFVWYRTFGHYLGLMTKDPKIFGQYLGGGKFSTDKYRPKHYLMPLAIFPGDTKEEKERIIEYLFGTAQILSGILCVWLLPPCPGSYALGLGLALKGLTRIYDVTKPLYFQNDISLLELNKVGESIKSAE